MQTKTKPNGDIIMKTFIKTVMAVSVLAASMGASATAGSYDATKDIRDRLDAVYHNFGANFAVNDNGHDYVRGGDSVKEFGKLLYLIDLDTDIVNVPSSGDVVVGINSDGYIFADTSEVELGDTIVNSMAATEGEILAQVEEFTSAVEQDLFGSTSPNYGLYGISDEGVDENGAQLYDGRSTDNGGIATGSINLVVDAAVAANVALATSTDAVAGQGHLTTFNAVFDAESVKFNGAVAALGDVSSSLSAGGYASYELDATFGGGIFTASTGQTIDLASSEAVALGLMDNPADLYTAFIASSGALNGAAAIDTGAGIGYTTVVTNEKIDGIYTGVVITTVTDADGTITVTRSDDEPTDS